MNTVVLDIPEAIGSNHRARVDPDAIAYFGSRVDRHVWKEYRIFSQPAFGADVIAAMQRCSSSDSHVAANHTMRTYVSRRINLSSRCDHRGRMNARRKHGLGKKHPEDTRKGNTGVPD